MNKHTFLVGLLLMGVNVYGQEVIATQGDSYSTASGSIDYTIGEVVTFTATDGNNDLTQGFHQTNWNFLGLDDHAPNFEVGVFPNPTEHYLNIQTETYENVRFILTDAQGKLIMTDVLSNSLTTLEVAHLATGIYNLSLESNGVIMKTFRLAKHL